MKGELQKRRILGRGKEVFIGVDVHKESWHVTARTEGEARGSDNRDELLDDYRPWR